MCGVQVRTRGSVVMLHGERHVELARWILANHKVDVFPPASLEYYSGLVLMRSMSAQSSMHDLSMPNLMWAWSRVDEWFGLSDGSTAHLVSRWSRGDPPLSPTPHLCEGAIVWIDAARCLHWLVHQNPDLLHQLIL